MRYNAWEDNIKSRLVERTQLRTAVENLMAQGVPEELIPVRLARAFYVDMDELNAVLDLIRTTSGLQGQPAFSSMPLSG